MDYAAILKRTETCIDGLPKREVSRRTQKAYRKTFARMLRAPILDPLKPDIACNTYGHRRAALHWGSRFVLERTHRRLEVAAGHLSRREPRLCSRPPRVGRPPPGRIRSAAPTASVTYWACCRRSGTIRYGNARLRLGRTPPINKTWMLWRFGCLSQSARRTSCRANAPTAGRQALRCTCIQRIASTSPSRLRSRIKAGTAIIKIHPSKAGAAASYLAARCGDGAITISLVSEDASRKKLMRLGKIALPDCTMIITPNVFRNQAIADWKATVGAGIAGAA